MFTSIFEQGEDTPDYYEDVYHYAAMSYERSPFDYLKVQPKDTFMCRDYKISINKETKKIKYECEFDYADVGPNIFEEIDDDGITVIVE